MPHLFSGSVVSIRLPGSNQAKGEIIYLLEVVGSMRDFVRCYP